MDLEIIVITYNRAKYLQKTLGYLSNSNIKNLKITVLDNASSDETLAICQQFEKLLPNFLVVSHKNNIGLGANIIRALEISSSYYTWVLCDDDILDLSNFDDVEKVINDKSADLIQVGGHPQKEWTFGNKLYKARELYSAGYPYFKFSSFLPSNIFKTKQFQEKFLIAGYSNVVNAYPHMPYLFNVYIENESIYVSKKQIVTAKVSGQSYDSSQWFFWWMRTCELLGDETNIRNAFFDQWKDIGQTDYKQGLQDFTDVKRLLNNDEYFVRFQYKYFSDYDKAIVKSIEKIYDEQNAPKFSIRSFLYNKFAFSKK